MMPDLGKYAFDVLVAYGLSLGILAVLVVLVVARGRRATRDLALYEQGRKR